MDFQYNDDDNMDMVQYHENEDDYNDVKDEDDVEDEDEDSENEEDGDYNDVEDKDSDDDIENDSEVSEDDNNGENDNHEQDDREEHHQIIDKALDKDNMPTYDGEFAPYFQNFTTAALFCWIQKHNILTNAYKDLVDIITKSEFNGNHVVKNIQRFRT